MTTNRDNVAQTYPARTDDHGTTWYRPVRDQGMDLSQWGWTSQPELAHPDYTQEEVGGTNGD